MGAVAAAVAGALRAGRPGFKGLDLVAGASTLYILIMYCFQSSFLDLDAASDAERAQLASELRGRIFAAARSACANYVLQKIIHVLRPQACQFIIDELMQDPQEVPALARHQYGCRILQRLLEHCQSQQMGGIIQLLLSEALSLKALLHAPQKVALARSLVQKLWASRYGRLVVKAIPSLHQQCVGMTRREARVVDSDEEVAMSTPPTKEAPAYCEETPNDVKSLPVMNAFRRAPKADLGQKAQLCG
eukprot:g20591.t1